MPSEYSGSGDPRRTIELLWGVQRRRRGPKPSLSGEQIAATAIELADGDGLGGLSMRRLAEELGITAMSLYGYVPSKAELLDVMADRAYGEIVAGGDAGTPWQARLAALAEQHWSLLLSHPWLLQISASRPLLGPNMTALYDAELAAVDGLGLTDIDMDLVVSLLDDYVRGAARGAAEAAEARARTGMSDQQWWETYGPLLGEVLDPGRYPTAVRVGSAAGAEYGAAHDPARSFGFGLARIIDGIEAFVRTASRLQTPPDSYDRIMPDAAADPLHLIRSFASTVSADPDRDFLRNRDAAADWLHTAGILPAENGLSNSEHAALLRLRTSIIDVLAAHAGGREDGDADARLTRALADGRLVLTAGPGGAVRLASAARSSYPSVVAAFAVAIAEAAAAGTWPGV